MLPRHNAHAIALALTLAVTGATSGRAAVITKANNADNLNLASSWIGGVLPGSSDTALWDSTVTGPNTTFLGSDLTWKSIQITNPGGDVVIGDDGHTLNMPSGTLDLSAATRNLTMDNNLASGTSGGLTFNVSTALTLNGKMTLGLFNSNVVKSGQGVLTLAGIDQYSAGAGSNSSITFQLSDGTLKLGSDDALNLPNAHLQFIGGTLDLAGHVGHASFISSIGTGAFIANSSPTPATLVMDGDAAAVISDGVGIINFLKTGSGTRMTKANTYSGSTTIEQGTLLLSFGSAGTNIVSPNSTLVLAGGILSQTSSSSTLASQTFNNATVARGDSSLSPVQSATTNLALTLMNISRPSPGGTVNYLPAVNAANPTTTGIFTGAATTTSGILGGWAVFQGADWATRDTNSAVSAVIALAPSQYMNAFAPSANTDMTANLAASTNASTGSVRFNNASATLTLNGANVIESGGILVTSNATACAINGTSPTDSLTSGNGTDIIFYHAQNRVFTLAASLVDNGTTSIALTKSGYGTLVLSAPNTYSGGTFINNGTVLVNAGSSLGTGPVLLAPAVNVPFFIPNTSLILGDGVNLNNNITLNGTVGDLAPVDTTGGSAVLSGSVSNSSGYQYYFGIAHGTLTLNGTHTSGANKPLSSPVTTTLAGGNLTFAGNSSLTSYRAGITVQSYTAQLNLTLRDAASFTVLNVNSGIGFGLSGTSNTTFTIQDSASVDIGPLDFTLFKNINLNGGSIEAGRFIHADSISPLVYFNGTRIIAATDSTAFLPSFNGFDARVQSGGAIIDSNSHNVTIAVSLIHDSALGATLDGGLTKFGPGTLTLTASGNAYTGPTTITDGAVVFGGTNVTHNVGIVTGQGMVFVAAGDTLMSNGMTVNSLRSDGNTIFRTNSIASKIQSVVIANGTSGGYTGKLDLTNNKLIVQSTDTNDKATKIGDLNAAINAGANGATWTGNGITSSTAAGNASHYGVGLFDNAILQKTSFGGQPTDTNSIFVTIAHLGDANDDGVVNIQDVSIVANNWQKSRNNWAQGDLNRDGIVNIQDYSIVANNWQQTSIYSLDPAPLSTQNSALGGASTSSAPEPASLAILASSVLLLLTSPKPRKRR